MRFTGQRRSANFLSIQNKPRVLQPKTELWQINENIFYNYYSKQWDAIKENNIGEQIINAQSASLRSLVAAEITLLAQRLKRWSNDAVLAGKCLKRWLNDAVLSGKSVPPQ